MVKKNKQNFVLILIQLTTMYLQKQAFIIYLGKYLNKFTY